MSEMTIEKWLNGVYYDDAGQMIFSKDDDKGSQLIADIRGWGALKHEFETDNQRADFQDKVGRFIVEAIKEKLYHRQQLEEVKKEFNKRVEEAGHGDYDEWYNFNRRSQHNTMFNENKSIKQFDFYDLTDAMTAYATERVRKVLEGIKQVYNKEGLASAEKLVNKLLTPKDDE